MTNRWEAPSNRGSDSRSEWTLVQWQNHTPQIFRTGASPSIVPYPENLFLRVLHILTWYSPCILSRANWVIKLTGKLKYKDMKLSSNSHRVFKNSIRQRNLIIYVTKPEIERKNETENSFLNKLITCLNLHQWWWNFLCKYRNMLQTSCANIQSSGNIFVIFSEFVRSEYYQNIYKQHPILLSESITQDKYLRSIHLIEWILDFKGIGGSYKRHEYVC